jgi:hypothetical protein
MAIIRALQAIFHAESIGHALIAELQERGVEGIRADCQKLADGRTLISAHQVDAITREVRAAGLHCLTTVYTADQCAFLRSGDHVEFRGEPDIGHPGNYADTQPIPPAEYRRLLFEFHAAVAGRGIQVWAPAIANLNTRGLEWLAAADPASWPADINVTLHSYPHGETPTVPHPGFRSRDHEVEVFRRIIGRRPFIVSEFGYHTAPRVTRRILGIPVQRRRWTDDQVAEYVDFEWRFWDGHGATGAVLYQLNDGPSDTTLDRYGIRRVDGTWKPVARTFAEGR